jgi:hypothetical protein
MEIMKNRLIWNYGILPIGDEFTIETHDRYAQASQPVLRRFRATSAGQRTLPLLSTGMRKTPRTAAWRVGADRKAMNYSFNGDLVGFYGI